jgi:hypothetical protein
MGGCTSKRAAAVKAQQQSNGKCATSAKPPKKKKKKSKAKIYSAFASMESLSNEIPVSHIHLIFIHWFFVLLWKQKHKRELVC